MSHGLGCAVEAALVVQGERLKENKGTVIWVIVQPGKGNWGGKVRDDRVKEKASRVKVACGHDIALPCHPPQDSADLNPHVFSIYEPFPHISKFQPVW